MSCNTCQSSYTPCTCAKSCNYGRTNFYGCPEPPPLPPCGYTINEFGDRIPIWHPVHPLIPMFLEMYGDVLGDVCDDDPVYRHRWNDIKTHIDRGVLLFSTCTYRGNAIYKVICLYAAACLELQSEKELYRSMQLSAAAQGNNFTIKSPRFNDGFYGQMLLSMTTKRKNGYVVITN